MTDIRLIAVDMDGTLLDGDGSIPETLWPLLDDLHDRGILFAPASGRQLATLQASFTGVPADEMIYIAENGAYVVHGNDELSSDELASDFVARLVARLRGLAGGGHDIGVVVCGKRSAYIERADAAFHAEADRYYRKLQVVPDLLETDDQVLKVAVFDFANAERTAPELDAFRVGHQVVVSGKHWIDVMNQGVNKGVALERLQRALGIDRAQTVAFGDYLNDLELLDAAGHSYAMANAHPEVLARARFRSPANTEHGVITTIRGMLDGSAAGVL